MRKTYWFISAFIADDQGFEGSDLDLGWSRVPAHRCRVGGPGGRAGAR